MIEYVDCDIFEAPIDILASAANCQHIHGGLMGEIVRRYPEAKLVDLKTKKGDRSKLGTYSKAVVEDANSKIKYIVHIYSQFSISTTERMTDYEALSKGLEKLEKSLVNSGKSDLVVGVPFLLASDKGKGDWQVVEAIINSVFESSPVKLLICKHPVFHKGL